MPSFAADMILIMPNKVGLYAYYFAQDMVNVTVAVAARENSDSNSCCHYFARELLQELLLIF
jgi:hypothetical protein